MGGPEIFISYSHANHDVAEKLAHTFEEAGRDVWWDREIGAGARFRSEIERNLTTARTVVVLWSADSVKSDWVLGEAAVARGRDVLIPVSVGECELPIEYRQLHTIDLTGWLKQGRPHALDALLEDIALRLDPNYVREPRKKTSLLAWQANQRRKLAFTLLGLVAAAVLVTLLILPTPFSETVCRRVDLCLSGAPRIQSIERVGERLFLVSLNGSARARAVFSSGEDVLFSAADDTALLYAEDEPYIGDYVPTSPASQDIVEMRAKDFAEMPAELFLQVLDRFPDLAVIDPVVAAIRSRIEVPRGGRSCTELADAARRIVAKKRLGSEMGDIAALRIRLGAEALSCEDQIFPRDW